MLITNFIWIVLDCNWWKIGYGGNKKWT
jgi:hypothetical protein